MIQSIATGYSVTVARVVWDDLVSVQIRVPRQMKKIYLLIIVTVLATTITGLLFLYWNSNKKNTIQTYINNELFTLELADTPTERSMGLSHRASLPDNTGMWFVFEAPGRPGFWMKDMQFDLDFLWLNNTIIEEVTINVPAPKNAHGEIVKLVPSKPITSAIEVKAGTVERLDIRLSNHIEISKKD